MTGSDIFATLGIDPSKPARTLRMVCDALAAVNAGKRVIVVCGNHAEVRRIRLTAMWASAKSALALGTILAVVPIQFVEVSRDPMRYLRGTSGVKVFVDHFAARQRGAIDWFDTMWGRA